MKKRTSKILNDGKRWQRRAVQMKYTVDKQALLDEFKKSKND